MKTATWITTAVVALCLISPTLGQRTLPRSEVLDILEQLAGRPSDAWIPAGTIEATHTEYKAPKTTNEAEITQAIQSNISAYVNNSDKRERTEEIQKMRLDAIPFNTRYRLANESTMTTSVKVTYDGGRFHWTIDVISRRDSVQPDASLADNYLTEEFNVDWNRRRVFAWDGQKYTTYTSANQATVDAAGLFPHTVTGPLTAGLLAWGNGPYSLANLRAADASATEVSLNGRTRIEMELAHVGGLTTSLTLDPERDHAMTAATVAHGDKVTSYRCSGYEKVGARWVPGSVTIERRDAATNRLLRSDEWSFTSVDVDVPAPSEFAVAYAADTTVSYLSTVADKPATYLYSHTVDTDRLLADRLTYAASEGVVPQNCATAAIQHVTSELGKPVSREVLESLVGARGETTLLAMKRCLLGQGLYCRAVRADVQTLKELGPVRAILHVRDRDHFVALDSADDREVRLVDLSKDKFYYRKQSHFFPMDWPDGTALLVSTSPITGAYEDIEDATLDAMAGGWDGYTCTEIIHQEDWVFCSTTTYDCWGMFTYWWYVCDCETGTGSCFYGWYENRRDADCLWEPGRDCFLGPWWFYYMRGCDGGPYQDCVEY